jgi:hypothetical protein
MLPEVATLVARAGTARYLLDDLLAVLGDADYERRAMPGEWTVREVVAHVAAADRALAELARQLTPVGAELGPVIAARDATWSRLRGLPHLPLLEAAAEARAAAVAALDLLPADCLAAPVVLLTDARGGRGVVETRAYLAAWAAHDNEHAAQVRAALLNPLSPTALAFTAGRSRG